MPSGQETPHTNGNHQGRFAYITLITRPSYLAGVIILAYTLRKHHSQYPLIVLHTPNLTTTPAYRALTLQATPLNLILHETQPLLPPANVTPTLIAERFTDTWTKLRVFSEPFLFHYQPGGLCYLDADMSIYNANMDQIFSYLPDLPPDHIAANHACVCNLDSDPWAPDDWTKANCAYTPQTFPAPLDRGTPVLKDSRPTHHLLNSGMFLYHPSAGLWEEMSSMFHTSPKLGSYKFPDQDFLADFFSGRWRSIGWQWNALKTMRYWHPNIWRDDTEVRCLHYIVDKPWASRVKVGERGDLVAGYKGRDGETHEWWWRDYGEWKEGNAGTEEGREAVGIVEGHVAAEEGEHADPDMRAIGSGVQAFANNTVGK